MQECNVLPSRLDAPHFLCFLNILIIEVCPAILEDQSLPDGKGGILKVVSLLANTL
jgi:hypothetical protein